jgi:hypothetical protein
MSTHDKTGADAEVSTVVVLGTHRIPVLALQVVETMNQPDTANATVAAAPLANRPADYRPIGRIQIPGHVLFGGWVIRARPETDAVVLELSNGPALNEYRFDQLALAGIHHAEVVWSIAQMAGFTPENLQISGLMPVSEAIVTVLPLTGITLGVDIDAGPVRLTTDRGFVELAAQSLSASPAKARLIEAGAWAVVNQRESLLLPAEIASVRLIEAAIDRIALEAQYSLACDPDGHPLPFTRDALLSDPTAIRLALVHGDVTGRTWLRTLDNAPVVLPLGERRISVPPVGAASDLGAAIQAWRRVIRTRDAVAATGALFESLEFYVGGLATEPIVTRAKCREIRRALREVELTDQQQQRLNDVLGWINRPPLKARLLAALKRDGVPYSDAEIEALWRLRKVRNEALHAAAVAEPVADDLEVGRAFVNRVLVFRIWRERRMAATALEEA